MAYDQEAGPMHLVAASYCAVRFRAIGRKQTSEYHAYVGLETLWTLMEASEATHIHKVQ